MMASKTPVAAIFDGLKGSWRLRRSLNSVLPGFPSGTFEGVATFKPRQPTSGAATGELLYSEQGELKMENGLTLKANRKYVYRYDADEDKISAWFVKEDTKQKDGKEEVDYLFHDLEMDSPSGYAWAGRGEHLCSLDMYWAYYEFRLPKVAEEGQGMDVFGVRYKVKGPQKDYTSDTAYERTFSSDVAVLLESILLPPNEAVGNILLDHLDHASLLNLRRCNRACRDIVTTRSPQLFQDLYINAPLRGNSALREIDIVGPHCRHLTIKVKLAGTSRSVSQAIAPIRNSRNSFLKDALQRSRESRAGSVAAVDALQDPEALGMDQTLWSHAFAWCGRVATITLRVYGDTIWPGRTSIEDLLVTLRMSLENSRMPQLRSLELQPIHAMGIIHLRWDPFGVWRAAQPTGAQLWRNLTTLKLTLHNPSDTPRSPEIRAIIPSQYLMFLKMLQAYLRSFSPTLQCLKFLWRGDAGPSPILLHREQGMESQQPIQWTRLDELWYGNITHQRGTLMALPKLAPSLTKIKALRAAGPFIGISGLQTWQDITVPNAYTSYAPGHPDDVPVPRDVDVVERIQAANAAHAQNRITPTPSKYDRPLSALLNKLSKRPVPRKRLRIQHQSPPQSPPPTVPLPPVPSKDAAAAARTALIQSEAPRSALPKTPPPGSSSKPASIADSASTRRASPPPSPGPPPAVEHPAIPEAPSPNPEASSSDTAFQRVANWRKAMALSTISFADTNTNIISNNRDTIFSETNTDADDLYDGNGRPRPDSEAWPITRFQARNRPASPALTEIPNNQEGTLLAHDSMESLITVVKESAWSDSSGSEYSDEDADERDGDIDRMSIISARVAPLRIGGARTKEADGGEVEPPLTATTGLHPPRNRTANTGSIYSEVGAYGLGTYRPPAR